MEIAISSLCSFVLGFLSIVILFVLNTRTVGSTNRYACAAEPLVRLKSLPGDATAIHGAIYPRKTEVPSTLDTSLKPNKQLVNTSHSLRLDRICYHYLKLRGF
jgi:hypothetical protein